MSHFGSSHRDMAPVRSVRTSTDEPKAKNVPRCGILAFGSIRGDALTAGTDLGHCWLQRVRGTRPARACALTGPPAHLCWCTTPPTPPAPPPCPNQPRTTPTHPPPPAPPPPPPLPHPPLQARLSFSPPSARRRFRSPSRPLPFSRTTWRSMFLAAFSTHSSPSWAPLSCRGRAVASA